MTAPSQDAVPGSPASDAEDPRSWIGRGADGVVLVHRREGRLLVDRPSRGTFRSPVDATVTPDELVVDGVRLHPVGPLPEDLDGRCGWYDAPDGRTLLLTQIPEAYFGQPMVLLGEGDRVVRAYALDAHRLLDEDGRDVRLLDGALRVDGLTWHRSASYTERRVTFTVGDTVLAGTVIRPAGGTPRPGAVVVHGAAGGQRDWCRLLAAPVLEAGIAVLVYDKAGHGVSGGDEPTIFDQADAVEAALAVLAADPDVDDRRLGLVGVSNGMWAVPMVAARRGVSFVAGIGSPGVSMAESEVHRRVTVLRDSGVGSSTLQAVARAWRAIFRIASEGVSNAVADELAGALRLLESADDLGRYDVPDVVRENPMLSPIPPLVPVEQLVRMLDGMRDPELGHDPARDYARLTCPVLLQYGADDSSVPVEASVEAVRAAAPHVDVRVQAGLEHLLNVVPDVVGLGSEEAMYGYHLFRFGTGVRAELTSWLGATVRRPVV